MLSFFSKQVTTETIGNPKTMYFTTTRTKIQQYYLTTCINFPSNLSRPYHIHTPRFPCLSCARTRAPTSSGVVGGGKLPGNKNKTLQLVIKEFLLP